MPNIQSVGVKTLGEGIHLHTRCLDLTLPDLAEVLRPYVGHQNGDDRNHNQELQQREAAPRPRKTVSANAAAHLGFKTIGLLIDYR